MVHCFIIEILLTEYLSFRFQFQLLYLSEERLLFDDIPLLSEVTRIVFLKNISSKFALSFRWLLESSPESEVSIIFFSTFHSLLQRLSYL